MSRAVKKIAQWCRMHRHDPIDVQHRTLSQKVRGHYAYYGITGNARALGNFLVAARALLAEVAGSPQLRAHDDLGAIQPAAEALLASAAESRSLGVRQVANPCSEEPYALMRARTDLWEPWAGNHPGRPGRSSFLVNW